MSSIRFQTRHVCSGYHLSVPRVDDFDRNGGKHLTYPERALPPVRQLGHQMPLRLAVASRVVPTVNQIPVFESVRVSALIIPYSSAVVGPEFLHHSTIAAAPSYSRHSQKIVNTPPIQPAQKENKTSKDVFLVASLLAVLKANSKSARFYPNRGGSRHDMQ